MEITMKVHESRLNPYTTIVMEEFDNAIDKLYAMSMDENWNRMRVGSCFSDGVDRWIWRTGEEEFTVQCTYEIDVDPEFLADLLDVDADKSLVASVRKEKKGLTAAQVVEMVGEHDIMAHEMFELKTSIEHPKLW